MHNIPPNVPVRIIQFEIAVPIDADLGEIADELSERLDISQDGVLLDWRYTRQEWETTPTCDAPEKGEVFGLPRQPAKIFTDSLW